MSNYLVKFTPLEPYFFGGEKSLVFGDSKKGKLNSYFIRSNEQPSQTTLLGALRYCCIDNIRKDYEFDPKIIGADSFQIDASQKQSFGVIQAISPLFLICDAANELESTGIYIKTPFDHIQKEDEKYTPFKDYFGIETEHGIRLLTSDFNAKNGITDSYINLTNEKVRSDLFLSDIRTGINKRAKDEGLFKKEHKMLKEGFSFAIYAEIEREMQNRVVYLGQKKSAFSVVFIKQDESFSDKLADLKAKTTKLLCKYPIKYSAINMDFTDSKAVNIIDLIDDCVIKAVALSDLYVSPELLYQHSLFASTKTNDFRTFSTKKQAKCSYTDRFSRGNTLIRMIAAGSFFILKEQAEFDKAMQNEQCMQIGYNTIAYGGKKI